jgi:transposase-like protein
MPGLRSPRAVDLTAEVRATLVQLTRRPTVAAALAQRARIVLLAADGLAVRHIVRLVGMDRNAVRRWLDRFRAEGIDGLGDRPRPGRPRAFSP